MIRRIFALSAIALAATVVLALPPRALPVRPTPAGGPPVVRGVMHVHTTESDGSGTANEVAAAARGAGLAFVILTDHGDGTRVPVAPRYVDGVLLIDAVEISTDAGHVVAIDLPPAPYPLRGEPEDVLDDIRRQGGMSIVAHPTSGKDDLQWHERGQNYDGIEWLNGDSEWRDEPPLVLARVLAGYWFRPPESLALLLDRPVEALALWDRVNVSRSVVGVAGTDAHAKIGGDADHGGPAAVNLPAYEQSFRTFSIALAGTRLSGEPASDASMVTAAIRGGHVFTAVDALARPGRMTFTGRAAGRDVVAGDRVPAGSPVSIRVEVDATSPPPILRIYRNGDVVTAFAGTVLEYEADGSPAVYRADATLGDDDGNGPRRIPWLVSNPIYVGRAASSAPSPVSSTRLSDTPLNTDTRTLEGSPWTVEHSDMAEGTVQTVRALGGGTQTAIRYALGGVRSAGPFVAFVVPLSQAEGHPRLIFRGRATHPMRISVQVRAGSEQGSARWRQSVYLDADDRAVSLGLAQFRPVETGQPAAVPLNALSSLLIVVDSVNTALGTNGEFWIDDLALTR